jgi:hypothetical protein
MVGWRRHIIDMQTEENRGDHSILSHASPLATARPCEMVSIILSLPPSRFKIFYSAPYLQKPRFLVLPFILWL